MPETRDPTGRYVGGMHYEEGKEYDIPDETFAKVAPHFEVLSKGEGKPAGPRARRRTEEVPIGYAEAVE